MKRAVKRKILVVVAHPDDETIWAGGMLLRSKFEKTIICLCREKDKDRRTRFEKACKILNAKCFISDLDDSEEGNFKKVSNEDIIKRVLHFTKGKSYDYVFTHGENGEYGHMRHTQMHQAVNEMLNKKLLAAKKVFFFSYVKEEDFCDIDKSADKFIKLKDDCFKKKKHLIRNIYGFEENSFEDKCCNNVEAFKIKE